MAGAKLLTRDPPLLQRSFPGRFRQPGITEGPIARAAVLPTCDLAAAVAQLAVAAQLVFMSRLAQRRERRRVAAALGEAVTAEPELMRPPSQPQLVQMPLPPEPPGGLAVATDMRAPPQPRKIPRLEPVHQPTDRLRRLRGVLRDVSRAGRRLCRCAVRVELADLDLRAPADLPRLARREPREPAVAFLGSRRPHGDVPSRFGGRVDQQ